MVKLYDPCTANETRVQLRGLIGSGFRERDRNVAAISKLKVSRVAFAFMLVNREN